MTDNKTPMSARSSALRGSNGAADLARAGIGSQFAQDSLSTPGGTTSIYITSARVRAIAKSLTDHDHLVLDLLSTIHLATGAQIRSYVWGEGPSEARSARRQLANLRALRVVSRQCLRVGGVRSGSEGYAYSLDVAGQLLTATTARRRRPRQMGLPFIAHALAVTDCYLTARQLDQVGTIELVGFAAEPDCWRTFTGPGRARRILKPDAFMVTGSGDFLDHWFIEVDRDSESPSRIATKAAVYIDYYQSGREQAEHEVFPRVLWVVPDERRETQLTGIFSRLQTEQMFQVCPADRFAEVVAMGAGEDPA